MATPEWEQPKEEEGLSLLRSINLIKAILILFDLSKVGLNFGNLAWYSLNLIKVEKAK